MSDSLDLCAEIWNKVSPFINKKDRVYIAESLIEIFDDNGLADHFSEFADKLDGELRVAVASHFGIEDMDED